MALNVLRDVVSNPMGTARLLEGFSTLRRAEAAGISVPQLRALYPDLALCSDADIHGFTKVAGLLSIGKLRLCGRLFDGSPEVSPA